MRIWTLGSSFMHNTMSAVCSREEELGRACELGERQNLGRRRLGMQQFMSGSQKLLLLIISMLMTDDETFTRMEMEDWS